MKKIIFLALSATFLSTLCACSPSPAELAQQNRDLHKQLEKATTRQDSDAVWKQITEVETRARREFTKDEFKEYARLAHPDTTTARN